MSSPPKLWEELPTSSPLSTVPLGKEIPKETKKDKKKFPGEERHSHRRDYHSAEYEDFYRHTHKDHKHLEDQHYQDLFDFDDPMSDSDYDDLDEWTGIYHDEDPRYHPSHHIKHHYSDEQYYHSRDRYFPEDSYHAEGQMKYDVVAGEALVAHALGKKTEAPKPAPAP